MWYVYAIQSASGRSYVGSSERPNERLREHNNGKCESTRGRRWYGVFRLEFETRADAYLVERWLKVGNTKTKRELIVVMLRTQGIHKTTANTLTAAKAWQENTIRRNQNGF